MTFHPDIHKINAAATPEERTRALMGPQRYNLAVLSVNASFRAKQMVMLYRQRCRLLKEQSDLHAEMAAGKFDHLNAEDMKAKALTFSYKIKDIRQEILFHAKERRKWLDEHTRLEAEYMAEAVQMEAAE